MFWGRNSLRARHLAAAAILLTGASAAMADVLVIRATGPSAKNFPAGKKLPDNARISLQANDQIVLLNTGKTRTFRGPGTFTPNGPVAGTTQVAAAAAQPQRRARIGAVRSGGLGAPKSPTIWHADVAKSSNFCLAADSKPSLWRADATRPVTLAIAGGGTTRSVSWPAGQPTLSWPSDLPIREGADYALSWEGAAQPTKLKFRMLAGKPTDIENMATSLIERGCEQQLDLLIASMPTDAGTPSAG